MKSSLLSKFLSFSYGSWVGLAIGFFGTMTATRILAPEDFGKASMFNLAINIFMIFTVFGTDQAFVRFFYEEKEENRGGLLYNCLKTPALIIIITGLLIFLFSNRISIFLFDEENFNVILLLLIGIVAQVLYRFGTLVIRMQQKGNIFSILEICNRSFNLIFLLLFYFIFGKDYEIIIYASVLTLIILTMFSIFSERQYWSFQNSTQQNLMHSNKEIIAFSYPLVLTTLITWLFQSFNQIAIKQWGSFDELGLYFAAVKIIALLNIIQASFTTFWTPVCYENFEKAPDDKKFYQKMSQTIACGMFLLAALVIVSKDIIVFILGSDYREAAKIIPFLVFMPVMYTLSETTVIGINFYKKPQYHILIAAAVCLLNIAGNLILVPKFGAVGAAASTSISYIAFFSLRTQFSLKYYNVNYQLRKIYSIILALFVYAFYASLYASFYQNILTGLVVLSVIILLYYQVLSNFYKSYILSFVKQMR